MESPLPLLFAVVARAPRVVHVLPSLLRQCSRLKATAAAPRRGVPFQGHAGWEEPRQGLLRHGLVRCHRGRAAVCCRGRASRRPIGRRRLAVER